jgi:hypothetical protein
LHPWHSAARIAATNRLGAGGSMDEDQSKQGKLLMLRQQHRDLDAAIESLEASVVADQLQLRRLKKQKLLLKDVIQQVEDSLIPNIIA